MKIRSTPTDGKAKAQIEEWWPETTNEQFQGTAVPNENRNPTVDISANRSSSGDLYTPPPPQNLSNFQNFSQKRGEDSQNVVPPCTSDIMLENALSAKKVNKNELWKGTQRFRDQLNG